jgi:hypothetical protein
MTFFCHQVPCEKVELRIFGRNHTVQPLFQFLQPSYNIPTGGHSNLQRSRLGVNLSGAPGFHSSTAKTKKQKKKEEKENKRKRGQRAEDISLFVYCATRWEMYIVSMVLWNSSIHQPLVIIVTSS